ncbi:MAG: hypothetical protein RIC95_11910 [Vicingaceae bacterium]
MAILLSTKALMTFPSQKNSKKLFLLALFALLSVLPKGLSAQLNEIGINFGYISSRYTIDNNFPDASTIIAQGRLHSGYTMGAQWILGPPKDQPRRVMKLNHGLMVEANLSRSGGNIAYTQNKNSPTLRNYSELVYVNYRGDYSIFYSARFGKYQFLLGPSVSNFFFRGLKVKPSQEYRSSKNQFNDFVFSWEVGSGFRFDKFLLSLRYKTAITDFGKPTNLIPATYNYHQAKFIISYFFLEKHKGKYWDSIYWK